MTLLERQNISWTAYEEPLINLEYLLPSRYRPVRSELEPFRTRPEWLLTPSQVMGSDHSTDHPARVLIWQEYIARYYVLHGYPLTQANQIALKLFASIHDSQRIDDGDDIFHGMRAARLALDLFKDSLPDEVTSEVMYLCQCHVPHDHNQPPLTLTGKIAKDADLLDRGRGVNDLDRRFIRLPITHLLIHYARTLHTASLQIGTSDHSENVMQAAIQLGYVIDN